MADSMSDKLRIQLLTALAGKSLGEPMLLAT